MNTIELRQDEENSTTSISNTFIDTYMPRANGEFLKVYFLLARCLHDHSAVSLASMADALHHTEQDVKRALQYWADEHILHLDFDEEHNISGIELLPLKRKETAAGRPMKRFIRNRKRRLIPSPKHQRKSLIRQRSLRQGWRRTI